MLTAANDSHTWQLNTDRVPSRRDGDPQGLLLCRTGDRWFVSLWSSPEARNADSWCRLPSWMPRPQLPPLVEFLQSQHICEDDSQSPQLIAVTAIEAIFAWLEEETTDPQAHQDAYEAWIDLVAPILFDSGAPTQESDPEPEPAPSTNGNGNGNGHGHLPADAIPIAGSEKPRKSGAPGMANEGRVHRVPIPNKHGRVLNVATKLDEPTVKAIKAGIDLDIPRRRIAELCGSTTANVAAIANGHTWDHVQITEEERLHHLETTYADCQVDRTALPQGNVKQAREIRRLYHNKKIASAEVIASKLDVPVSFVEAVITHRVFRHLRY